MAKASPKPICRTFSSAFIRRIRRTLPAWVPAWDWPLPSASWNNMAGKSRWKAKTAKPFSPSPCPVCPKTFLPCLRKARKQKKSERLAHKHMLMGHKFPRKRHEPLSFLRPDWKDGENAQKENWDNHRSAVGIGSEPHVLPPNDSRLYACRG